MMSRAVSAHSRRHDGAPDQRAGEGSRGVDGELLLEAHPPVDAQGQSFEPEIDEFSELLKTAVGDTTVAIHWDYAREVLQKANGVIGNRGARSGVARAPRKQHTCIHDRAGSDRYLANKPRDRVDTAR